MSEKQSAATDSLLRCSQKLAIKCGKGGLQLELDAADEHKAVGIEKLLADHDKTISLIPMNTDRMKRRDDQ